MSNAHPKLDVLLKRAHRDESGAIMLLALAAFLIVLMTALVLYDAGQSGRDKMDVQIAADTAAFSQAAVKARSMNMIAYSNVAKRTFYAFDMMYTAAFLGMVEAIIEYGVECFPGLSLSSCAKAVEGGAQLAMELIVLAPTNLPTMGAMSFGDNKMMARAEVEFLNDYQKYIKAVAPWWGWSEGLTRGIRNGATITSSWPPPPGNLADVNSLWVKVSQFVDRWMGTDYYQIYPSLGAKDSLPLSQGDGFLDHLSLCASTAVSTEYMWWWGEHYATSQGFARDSKAVLFGILSTPLGCMAASMILGDEVLPFEIKDGLTDSYLNLGDTNTLDAWLKATSNIVLSYKMDPSRMSNTGARQKFNYMSAEYEELTPLAKGGGYFAVTRSEIVYQGGLISSLVGGLQGAAGGQGATNVLASTIGIVRDLFDQPNMWSARWTARMRPMQLPGESVPSFNGMYKDMLPYMLLASPIAFASSPSEFSLSGARGFLDAALLDLAFLEIASAGMSTSGGTQGFVK